MVGFLTFDQFCAQGNYASSRIRARWLVKYWPNAELFVLGRRYDAVIFQKVSWLEYARLFDGIKILDLCDPDFLHWSSRMVQMMQLCDAVTTSTSALAEAVRKYTAKPVQCIPDRLDFECFGGRRKGASWRRSHSDSGLVRT